MSTMLEIRHLRLVQAIAEEGGPTRAASRLHLTQSAVSHQLAELEGRLGIALFTRVRRRLTLTSAGARLVDAARTMLGELARVERDLHRAGRPRRQLLRIATECFTSYHWLPAVIAALDREHPHVEVQIRADATREPVAALLRGELELALVSSPVRDRQLVTAPLFDDEWTVICAPDHPAAQRPYVTATELGRERLFVHDAPRSDVERLRALIAAERAAMPDVRLVPLTDALVDLVTAGLGVGLVSSWAVAPHVARGEVVTRRFTKAGLRERWVAAYRSDAAGELPLARVASLVREHAGGQRGTARPSSRGRLRRHGRRGS
jgi:LysR family transcriptional regulator for metE and metH